MKLVHCADIHLGSAMASKLPSDKARERKEELFDAFKNIVKYARDCGARAILLCGDLFDTPQITKTLAHRVRDVIINTPEVDFICISGNHDPKGIDETLDLGDDVPGNLIIFKKGEWGARRYGKVVVTGTSLSDTGFPPLPPLSAEDINIVMLHGDITKTNPAEDGIDLSLLKNRNIDYLALGHLHSYSVSRLDSRGIICYPGCPEGRGFDETGKKGFVEITTNDLYDGGDGDNESKQPIGFAGNGGLSDMKTDRVSVRFVEAAKRAIHIKKADISGCVTGVETERAADAAVEGIPDCDMVRLILTGEYTAETQKDVYLLERRLAARFYYAEIEDKSRLFLNPDDYRNDISLKGEFVRLVISEYGENADGDGREERDMIISLGLKALRGEELDI